MALVTQSKKIYAATKETEKPSKTGLLMIKNKPTLAVRTPFGRAYLQPQSVQFNESFGVFLIICTFVGLESCYFFVKQRLLAAAPNHRHTAFIELQADVAIHVLLRLIDRRLQRFTLWRPPIAVINQLSVTRHQLVF